MPFDDPNLRNLVDEVSLKEVRVFNPGMDVSIIAFDCGMKANIIRYACVPRKILAWPWFQRLCYDLGISLRCLGV